MTGLLRQSNNSADSSFPDSSNAASPQPQNSCPGANSTEAGKAQGCAGCPNQSVCASAPKGPDPDIPDIAANLSSIQNIIIVLSGKGGVGKSSVASLLALYFASIPTKEEKRKLNVGLLDLDICGPSIPTIFGCSGERLFGSNAAGSGWTPVYPLDNLALVSVGFLLNSEDDALIWRGPRKNGLIKQFLRNVEWTNGDDDVLDFLIIDTPPGTSDEHLTIAKILSAVPGLNVSAILVTTPHDVSVIDVEKEIDFCKKTQIRMLGIVENMSNSIPMTCPNCKHSLNGIFDASNKLAGGKGLAEKYGLPLLGSIPLDPLWARRCDEGIIDVFGVEDNQVNSQYQAINAFTHICEKIKNCL